MRTWVKHLVGSYRLCLPSFFCILLELRWPLKKGRSYPYCSCYSKPYRYFKQLGVPGPQPLPVVGHLMTIGRFKVSQWGVATYLFVEQDWECNHKLYRNIHIVIVYTNITQYHTHMCTHARTHTYTHTPSIHSCYLHSKVLGNRGVVEAKEKQVVVWCQLPGFSYIHTHTHTHTTTHTNTHTHAHTQIHTYANRI